MVEPAERVQLEEREQSANSPDENICDLGFFRSLQSQTWQHTPATTIDGLIQNVEQAFADYDPLVLNRIWLTHAAVCDLIICNDGGNNYELPHMGKERLERQQKLPSMLPLSSTAKEHYFLHANIP